MGLHTASHPPPASYPRAQGRVHSCTEKAPCPNRHNTQHGRMATSTQFPFTSQSAPKGLGWELRDCLILKNLKDVSRVNARDPSTPWGKSLTTTSYLRAHLVASCKSTASFSSAGRCSLLSQLPSAEWSGSLTSDSL